jgi:hypothetical protein
MVRPFFEWIDPTRSALDDVLHDPDGAHAVRGDLGVCAKDSEAQGKLVPGNYPGVNATKLNIVQAKEPVKDDRGEQLAEIRNLIAPAEERRTCRCESPELAMCDWQR